MQIIKMSNAKARNDKVRVLYIAGEGKSGSTLLGKVLGQVEGFVDVGELITLHRQAKRDWKCGCGTAFSQCAFWRDIVQKSIGGTENLVPEKWRLLRSRYLPLLFIPGAKPRLSQHFLDLQKIYKTINETSRTKVIIDSSKSLFPCFLLELIPEFELYVIHLIRDIRGTENSNHRLKKEGSPKHKNRGPWLNSIRWILINLFAERLRKHMESRYLQVQYEDFIATPKEVLSKILHTVKEDQAELTFVQDCAVMLQPTHSLSGSRIRFKNGLVELRLDERWK